MMPALHNLHLVISFHEFQLVGTGRHSNSSCIWKCASQQLSIFSCGRSWDQDCLLVYTVNWVVEMNAQYIKSWGRSFWRQRTCLQDEAYKTVHMQVSEWRRKQDSMWSSIPQIKILPNPKFCPIQKNCQKYICSVC